MRTREQYNSKKLDLIIMAGHIQMLNWDMLQKPSRKQELLCTVLAIGLIAYTTLR